MKKFKQIKKEMKKKLGKKGTKFVSDVTTECMTAEAVFSTTKSFVTGIRKAKEKNLEKQERRIKDEFNEGLKTWSQAQGYYIFASLDSGFCEGGLYPAGHDRLVELKTKVENVLSQIYSDIDSGMFEQFAFMDDDGSGSFTRMLFQTFIMRIYYQLDLTAEEASQYHNIYETQIVPLYHNSGIML